MGNLSHKHLNEKYHGGNSIQTFSVTLEVQQHIKEKKEV